ncbi:MAG: DUF4252 domain-containing protein [Candidatus Zixiibacteriota bacterium]
MRHTNRKATLIVVAALPLLLSGCMRARQLEGIGQQIVWSCPEADFHRDVSLSLGPMSIGVLSWAAGLADDDEDVREARQYLRCIRSLQVVVYDIDGKIGDVRDLFPRRLQETLQDDDWELLVKSNEPDGQTWIHYREDNKGVVREMNIAALDRDEFVLVRISGNLNRLFEQALEDERPLTKLARKAGR